MALVAAAARMAESPDAAALWPCVGEALVPVGEDRVAQRAAATRPPASSKAGITASHRRVELTGGGDIIMRRVSARVDWGLVSGVQMTWTCWGWGMVAPSCIYTSADVYWFVGS